MGVITGIHANCAYFTQQDNDVTITRAAIVFAVVCIIFMGWQL
jgi:hypothetical protein